MVMTALINVAREYPQAKIIMKTMRAAMAGETTVAHPSQTKTSIGSILSKAWPPFTNRHNHELHVLALKAVREGKNVTTTLPITILPI